MLIEKGLKMLPRNHQEEGADWALATVRKHGLAYLSWKERTGKTLTALLAVEKSMARSCLIITKKKAIDGWLETLYQWNHSTSFMVINYESAHKYQDIGFDFIILDESHHAVSGIGRPSKTWKTIRKITKGKPIIYLSATPYAEHIGLIYHQLKLSDWTPFKKYVNFFRWYDKYGIANMTRTPYGLQDQRNRYRKDEVLNQIGHLFNFKTRQDVGIEHEPTVRLIKISPSKSTYKLLVDWREDKVIEVQGHEILGDSGARVRAVHYQIEGGTLKVNDKTSIRIGNHEKIDYIISNYDTNDIAIMAHFIEERAFLKECFPGVPIYSSDGHAEGVDLSHISKLIVYSMSFKTSKHTQRVARQANHNRATPIEVDILAFTNPGVGAAVYDTVAVKETNFVKDSYERIWISN